MGYFLALLIGAALLTAMVWKPAPPLPFVGLAGADIPRAVGGWVGGPDERVPADVQAALASATLTSRTYQPAAGYSVPGVGPLDFVLIGGTDRSALHDPRSCLIGAGMQVANDHLEVLPGTAIRVRACRAIDPTGTPGAAEASGFDIIYLYLVNGRVVSQATQIRAAMLWSAVLGRRGTPVYFLRFTRPIYSDPRQEALGHAAMLQFAREMWTKLQPRLMSSAGKNKGYEHVPQNFSRQYRLS